jgi:NAD(P)H-dependent FMN reductase
VGVTRRSVCRNAGDLGHPVHADASIGRCERDNADEPWGSETATEVTPIRTVDGVTVGEGTAGPVTDAIQSRFFDVVERATDDSAELFTRLNRTGADFTTALEAGDMSETHVVAVCGSLRDESVTRIALELGLEAAANHGASTELLDLREWDLPIYDADDEDVGEAVALRERVRASDSIVLGTPMYHGSYSSPLKTALDYCGFDEFEKKTVGLLGVSGGSFPITALGHLRSVCRALDAWVIPHQAAVPNASSRVEDGRIVDEAIADRVITLGEEAVRFANIEADPASFESGENVGARD